MAKAFHINVWTDKKQHNGKPEKRDYAAMADTREQALALAREKLPPTWKIEAPENQPPYGFSVIKEYDLKPGDVRWIG